MDHIGSDLKNKKVLITGASGGIGAQMARLFAGHGAWVGVHYYRGKDRACALEAELRKQAIGKVELLCGDLLEQQVRQTLVDDFIKIFGSIDVLINNAGAAGDYEDSSKLSEPSWDAAFDLNVKAPFYLMTRAFEHMKAKGGRIINISSVNVKYGGSGKSLHYNAAKAALESLQRGFAREGAPYNILVNCIRCGLIDTPMRSNIEGYSEANFQKRMALVPLKRAGKPMDVARMALFLAAESGDFITGETFTVAGGD